MAVSKEKTVAEKLKHLYELQVIDSNLDDIQVLKGELPIEVSDLEDEIAGLETRIGRLQGSVDDIEGQITRLDGVMKDARIAIEKYQRQMDDVKNNREYEALQKEIELQTLDIQLSEKKQGEMRVSLEAKQQTLAAAKERLEARNADLEHKRVALEKIVAKTEKEERKLKKQSETARKEIEDRLLKAYDKIRGTYRNGLAVVGVERNSCGGCFNQVPPQTRLEIGMHKKILACEHCGRILVDEEITNPAPAPVEE
jgi:predicted  nucleic acid-binding Zn-ribbon protein